MLDSSPHKNNTKHFLLFKSGLTEMKIEKMSVKINFCSEEQNVCTLLEAITHTN